MKKTAAGIGALIVAVLMSMLVLVAPAAAKSKHHVEGTALGANVRMSQDFPAVGSTADSVQLVEQRVDGGKVMRGAGESHATVKSGDLTSGLDVEGPFHTYYPLGSLKGTTTTKAALQPDGSVTLTGDINVTGGTGTFKGATGTLPYTASVPNATTVVAPIEYSGTLSY